MAKNPKRRSGQDKPISDTVADVSAIDALLRSDPSRAIDEAHRLLPIPPPPRDFESLLKTFPRNWRRTYELSLPEKDWNGERRKEVKRAVDWGARWITRAKREKNPLCLWLAYTEFRGANLPLPEPVLAYVDCAAHSLLGLIHTPPRTRRGQSRKKRDIARKIAGALFLNAKGQGSLFARFQNLAELVAGWEVYVFGRNKPRHTGIARTAQKLRINKHTARRHLAKFEASQKHSRSR